MIINQAWNPVWANAEHTAITLLVNFEEFDDNQIEFTARPDDVMDYGVELFNNASNGDYGIVAPYVAPPAPPIPVPSEISARQFLIAAGVNGIISQDEAVEAATAGTVPPAIQAVFDTLSGDEKFAAQITWAKMTTIPRADPLVTAVGAAFSMTSDQLDAFYIQAATL